MSQCWRQEVIRAVVGDHTLTWALNRKAGPTQGEECRSWKMFIREITWILYPLKASQGTLWGSRMEGTDSPTGRGERVCYYIHLGKSKWCEGLWAMNWEKHVGSTQPWESNHKINYGLNIECERNAERVPMLLVSGSYCITLSFCVWLTHRANDPSIESLSGSFGWVIWGWMGAFPLPVPLLSHLWILPLIFSPKTLPKFQEDSDRG